MPNERWRQIHQFLAVSGAGKVQSAYDVFQPNADLDTRDACTIEQRDVVNRRQEFDCDGADLVAEPIQNRFTQFRLSYAKLTPQILARWIAYHQGTAGASSGAVANEVQTLTRSGSVTGGTFTISITIEGKTGTTEAIAYDASTAVILAALLKKSGSASAMGKIFKAGDVTVGGAWGSAMTLTFAGRYAAANMPAVTVGNGSITGGGTIVVATSTGGDSELHAISRTTNGTLPYFSIATGDKNESIATQKFGNCAVDSIDINLEQGENVTATITLNAYYIPEDEDTSFDVPACVNITPLKTEDCRLSINGTYQTGDVQSLSISLNNNIPAEAAFGYDDIDQTTAFQRGDIPAQQFTASIFGSSDDSIYALAAAEETAGNEVAWINYLGFGGNRVTITGTTTKVYFQEQRLGFAGPLRQSVVNLIGSPHGSAPLTYSHNGSQTATFLTASS